MILNFSVSNYLSYDMATTLDLSAGKARVNNEHVYFGDGFKCVKFAALYGANATGKTNIIKAIKQLRRFVQYSIMQQPTDITNLYHRMKPENKALPSTFNIEFEYKETHYRYTFSVILSQKRFTEEALYRVSKTGREREIYYRDISGKNHHPVLYFKSSAANTKLNNNLEDNDSNNEALMLTLMNHGKESMYDKNPELSVLRDVYYFITRCIVFRFPFAHKGSDSMKYERFNFDSLSNVLDGLGFGEYSISMREVDNDMVMRETALDDSDISRIKDKLIEIKYSHEGDVDDEKPFQLVASMFKGYYIFKLDKENNLSIFTLSFVHNHNGVSFTLGEESDGTARILELLDILVFENKDITFLVDELDSSLNPSLTTKFVKLFLEKAADTKLQLITSTHEVRIIDEKILRNDEIFIVTKNDDCASDIIPLKGIKLRADKRLYEAFFDDTIKELLPKFNDRKLEKGLKVVKK